MIEELKFKLKLHTFLTLTINDYITGKIMFD